MQSVKELAQGALEVLLRLGTFLLWLAFSLSPVFLVANIARVVYGLLNGEISLDTVAGLTMGSIIYIAVISSLTRSTPEGLPSLDLAMTVLLTVVAGMLALFALATPWWALELQRAANMADEGTPHSLSFLLATITFVGILGTFVTGKEALAFYSRYKTHYHGLHATLRNLGGPATQIAEETSGAVKRGQLAFLYNADEKVTHVLVGQVLFPVRPGRSRYSPGDIREMPDEELVEFLQNRTGLNALPPERILALLHGRGTAKDLEEAQRAWAMERLSEF